MTARKPSSQADDLEAAFHRLHGTGEVPSLLIGLAGPKRAGKDTAADWICGRRHLYFDRIALADPIKDGLKAMLGLEHCELYDPKLKDTEIDWLGCTSRHLMQTLGTEWGQGHVCTDIWLRVAQRQINAIRRMREFTDGIVVTDIRFEHEADWIRKQGGQLWHIRRDIQASDPHSSEQGIALQPGDVEIFNTGSLAQLHAQLATALKEARQ